MHCSYLHPVTYPLRSIVQVESITETEVVCVAGNDAVLGGLLTVFHTERSVSSLTNLQNELPVSLAHHRGLPDSLSNVQRGSAPV